MRVVVTGGAGFIGSHIVERLLGEGDEVLVVDDLSTGKRDNVPDGARLVEMDIGDTGLTDVLTDFRPDALTHCAAQISVAVSMEDPLLDARTNVVGGLNVWQAAVRSSCPRFIYINTGGALYGEPDYLPCDEDHPIRPISGYGLSKWTLERYLKILTQDSMALGVLRLANVYGPRQDPMGEAGVISIFGLRMVRGKPVTVFGDGAQTRDYVYIDDVVRAHQIALAVAEPPTVNIGTGVATSVNELFRLMTVETEYGMKPEYRDERAGDVKHIYLDVSRAKRLLGWEPRTSLHDGLRETVAWLRTQA